MSHKRNSKPLSMAIGAALAASLVAIPAANADQNPFGLTKLSDGYPTACEKEGKCGEGKCGEGTCGGDA